MQYKKYPGGHTGSNPNTGGYKMSKSRGWILQLSDPGGGARYRATLTGSSVEKGIEKSFVVKFKHELFQK